MPDLTLTVFSGRECCLCDDAREVLDKLAPNLGINVEWVYIDGIAELEEKWREQIPVGILEGRKVFKYHVDPELLTRRVKQVRNA